MGSSPLPLQSKTSIMTRELIESIKPKEQDTVGEPHVPRWYSGPKYPKPRIWVSKDTLKKKRKCKK